MKAKPEKSSVENSWLWVTFGKRVASLLCANAGAAGWTQGRLRGGSEWDVFRVDMTMTFKMS